ncbi:YolD-like family protein [Rummeliibacillus sp. JY-2-4R]
MLRDRGNIKWTAMMLPEHVQRLRNWQQETKQIAKPIYDEWTLQALGEELMQAYCGQKEVLLEVWHQQASTEYRGIITALNNEDKKLCLYNIIKSQTSWIEAELILHVRIFD